MALAPGSSRLAGERGIYNNYSNVIAAIMRSVDGTGGDTGQEALNWAGAVEQEGQQALHSAGTSSADRRAKALRQRGGRGRRRKPRVCTLGAGRGGERGKEAGICPDASPAAWPHTVELPFSQCSQLQTCDSCRPCLCSPRGPYFPVSFPS